MAISAEDELLHEVGHGPHWQESFYFNWATEDSFGLVRMGFEARTGTSDAVVITMRDGRPEFFYADLRRRFADVDPSTGLRARGLTLRMLEPCRVWQIRLEGEHSIDLTWTAFTDPFDFHDTAGQFPSGIADGHFEQAGTVRGVVRLRGRERVIDGVGHRDKSWGRRDWAKIGGWEWISGQFGAGFAFNATVVPVAGVVHQAGWVFHQGQTRALTSVQIDHRWGPRVHVPASARITMVDVDGETCVVEGRSLAHFPLTKRGLWINESHAAMTAHVGGLELSGVGVFEHAYHVGRLGALARFPQLASALRQSVTRRSFR